MSSPKNGCVLFEMKATDLAFRVGQAVEQLLLDGGSDLARSSHTSIVTVEMIDRCIREYMHEDLRRQLDERTDQQPREVA